MPPKPLKRFQETEDGAYFSADNRGGKRSRRDEDLKTSYPASSAPRYTRPQESSIVFSKIEDSCRPGYRKGHQQPSPSRETFVAPSSLGWQRHPTQYIFGPTASFFNHGSNRGSYRAPTRSVRDDLRFRGPRHHRDDPRRTDHNPESFLPGQIIRFRMVEPSMDPDPDDGDGFLPREKTGLCEDLSGKMRFFVIVKTEDLWLVCAPLFTHGRKGKKAQNIMFDGPKPNYSCFALVKPRVTVDFGDGPFDKTPPDRTLYVDTKVRWSPFGGGCTLKCMGVYYQYNMPIQKTDGKLTPESTVRLQRWFNHKYLAGDAGDVTKHRERLGQIEAGNYPEVAKWRQDYLRCKEEQTRSSVNDVPRQDIGQKRQQHGKEDFLDY